MSTHDTDGRSDRRRNRGEVRNSFKELAKLASAIPPSQAALPPSPPSMPLHGRTAIDASSLVDDEEVNEIVTEDRTPAKMPPSARFSVPPVAVPMAAPSAPPQPVAISVPPDAARPSRGVGRAVTVGAVAGLFISALGIGGMVLMKKAQSSSVNDEPHGATAIHVAAQPVFGADAPAVKPVAAPSEQAAHAAKAAPKPSDGTLSIDDLPQAKKAALPAWYASRSYAAPARKPVSAHAAAPPDAPDAPEPEAKVETKPEPKAAEKPAPAKTPETKAAEAKTAAAPEPKAAPADAKGAAAAPADQGSGSNALLDEIRAAVKKDSKK